VGVALASSQAIQKFVLIKSIPQSQDSNFTTDRLGNAYVYNQSSLKKHTFESDKPVVFSRKDLNGISFVDASNPLKILVFYKDFSTLLFLDNTLSPSGDPLVLPDLNINQPIVVCTSNNNSFWVYNNENSQLICFNNKLQSAFKSANINQLLNFNLQPNFITEQTNFVYLNDPEIGILVFDTYANYVKTVPIKNLKSFQVIGETIFYYENNKLITFNTRTLAENSIKLPDSEATFCRYEQQKVYLQKKTGIDIYDVEFK
ncbi:MAG TPA: hypothetical protein DCP74_15945, partial [Bacteroidales bacterium]|nr:hypothetical protein [Bacteroidales bacterium]